MIWVCEYKQRTSGRLTFFFNFNKIKPWDREPTRTWVYFCEPLQIQQCFKGRWHVFLCVARSLAGILFPYWDHSSWTVSSEINDQDTAETWNSVLWGASGRRPWCLRPFHSFSMAPNPPCPWPPRNLNPNGMALSHLHIPPFRQLPRCITYMAWGFPFKL